jgi:hypothetical protein
MSKAPAALGPGEARTWPCGCRASLGQRGGWRVGGKSGEKGERPLASPSVARCARQKGEWGDTRTSRDELRAPV